MVNRHHVLFDRKSWSVGHAVRLRNKLIFYLDEQDHLDLHANCPPVPLPSGNVLCIISASFKPLDTPLRTVGSLLLALHGTIPKLHNDIEQDVVRLTIRAIERQVPYLEKALVYKS